MKRLRAVFCLASVSCVVLLAQPARTIQTPAAPSRYYGAIDLGSRGVKAFLYSFVREGEGPDARAVFKDEVNTKLVSGAQEGRLTPAGIAEATSAVTRLMTEMKAEAQKRNLRDVEYYVVGSSGVAQFPNHEELKSSVDKAAGIAMTFVDARQEAYYGLLSGVPKTRRDASVLIDIGSGNTKLACIEGGEVQSAEVPFGSVTLRTAGVKEDPDYQAGLTRVIDQQVRPILSAQTGCVANRRRVYWIGGAAWATATYAHPETALWGFINISMKDTDSFLSQLRDNSWLQRRPQFSFATDVNPAARQTIQTAHLADRKRVSEVFSREDLLAGVSLMKAILQSHGPAPTVYFVRNGNYLFGYALEKYREDAEVSSTAPEPDVKGPTYFAGIDLGARGIKAYVYSFVREGEGTDARAVFKDEINTKLVSSADGNKFTARGINEATEAAAKLVGEMKAFAQTSRIAPRYYIVGSSGVARFENHDELKDSVERATGLQLEFVDVRREGYYGLVSAIPANRRQEALHVDIGSSNTKLGCMVRDLYNPEEIPYGSVTLRTAVPQGTDFLTGLQNVLVQVRANYNTARMNTPCLGSRSKVYFIGGASWATATFAHPETALWGYVPLTRRDVDVFFDHLADGTWNQKEPQFYFAHSVTAKQKDEIRKAHLVDRQSVQNVFSREDLLAGVSLIRTIVDSGNPSAKIWFVRNGNYLFGYALEKYKDIRFDEDPSAPAPGIDAATPLPRKK